MILEVAEMNGLMDEHYDRQNGVVNLKRVEQLIRERGADVTETLLSFCGSREHWVAAALSLVYSLVQRGEFTEDQSRRFLPMIEHYGSIDLEEYYKAINAFGQQRYVDVLIELLEKLFGEKKVRDWRWLGYSVVGQLIGRQLNFHMRADLADSVIQEAYREPDTQRRDQLIFLAGRLAENQKSYLSQRG